MENYAFKSVAFGGFDKQDVIHYIEQTAKGGRRRPGEAAEGERGPADRGGQPAGPRSGSCRRGWRRRPPSGSRPSPSWSRSAQPGRGLEAFKPEAERLAAELERLRPEAEAYAQFRTGWGTSSATPTNGPLSWRRPPPPGCAARGAVPGPVCDADVLLRVHRLHVTAELRKVEVNLSQLPRAMDQAGTELNELPPCWTRSTKKEEKEPRG